MQKPQRLGEVPPVDIQRVVDRQFDHITVFLKPQIRIFRADVDEPYILVAVRRGKAPCPAAGFDRQQDPHILCLFNLSQFFLYCIFHPVLLLSACVSRIHLLFGG